MTCAQSARMCCHSEQSEESSTKKSVSYLALRITENTMGPDSLYFELHQNAGLLCKLTVLNLPSTTRESRVRFAGKRSV